jgi:hypothetical protein
MSGDPIAAIAAATVRNNAAGVRIFELAPPGSAAATPQVEARFQAALTRAGGLEGPAATGAVPAPLKGMFDALDQINVKAKSVSDYAATAEASGGQLTPGEMVMLTMRCQEFMFQSQLASNIANRSSDGVQQLFKQQ